MTYIQSPQTAPLKSGDIAGLWVSEDEFIVWHQREEPDGVHVHGYTKTKRYPIPNNEFSEHATCDMPTMDTPYHSLLKDYTCKCGKTLQAVRPGKYQCPECG